MRKLLFSDTLASDQDVGERLRSATTRWQTAAGEAELSAAARDVVAAIFAARQACASKENIDPLSTLSDDPTVTRELERVTAAFEKRCAEDEKLTALVLINPIRAFRDAGVEVAREVVPLIPLLYPRLPYSQDAYYDAVRDGTQTLSWIQQLQVVPHRPVLP